MAPLCIAVEGAVWVEVLQMLVFYSLSSLTVWFSFQINGRGLRGEGCMDEGMSVLSEIVLQVSYCPLGYV